MWRHLGVGAGPGMPCGPAGPGAPAPRWAGVGVGQETVGRGWEGKKMGGIVYMWEIGGLRSFICMFYEFWLVHA